MKIAINAIRVSKQGGGGLDHYMINLVNHLAKMGLEFDLFTTAHNHFPEVNTHRIQCPALFKLAQRICSFRSSADKASSRSEKNRFSGLRILEGWADFIRLVWTQLIFPLSLYFGKYDLVFSPSQMDVLPFPPIKQVITILDMIPFLFPNQKHKHLLFLKKLLPIALKKSAHVIAISENTKRDIMRLFHASESKITAIPIAIPEDLKGNGFPPEVKIKEVKEKYGLTKYIFCLSNNDPHKNLGRLLEAFSTILNQTSCALVIAGYQKGEYQWLLNRTVVEKGLKDRVHFLGHVPLEDLPALYGGAQFFVYPSLYEGFGLPPLEALSYGVPTLVSGTSSLPEVVADAALTFDPLNAKDLAEKMEKLLKDEKLRMKLKALGPIQAQLFSWEKTAQQTLKVLTEASLSA